MALGALGWLNFPWEKLLEGLREISTRELRQNAAEAFTYVQQGRGSIRITKHGSLQVVLVASQDAAVLQAVQKHPEIIKQLEELHPELKDRPK